MKKNIARATLASGLTVGLLATGVAGAFAAPAETPAPSISEATTTAKQQLDDVKTDSDNLSDAGNQMRIWGQTRSITSVEAFEILEKDGKIYKDSTGKVDEIFLVGGRAFADPLALTPLVDALNSPVLMTEDANNISQQVLDTIKRVKPARVTVVGGPLSVSDETMDKVREVAGAKAIVDRVAGDTRFDTAVTLASYATAAYHGRPAYENLRSVRDKLYDLRMKEKAFKDALKYWEETRAHYATEKAVLDKLFDQREAKWNEIADLLSKVQATGNADELKSKLKTAQDTYTDALAALDQAAQARTFLGEKVSNLVDGASTHAVKSTVADYRKLFNAAVEKAAKELKTDEEKKFRSYLEKFNKVVADLGANDTTLIEDGLDEANTLVGMAKQMVEVASKPLVDAVADFIKDERAVKANHAIYEQVTDRKAELDEIDKKIVEQYKVVQKAIETMAKAQEAASKALMNMPAPGQVAMAAEDLKKAIDEQASKAGAYTVFAANARGNEFADALVGGPAATRAGGLILLVDGENLPASTAKFLKAANSQVVTVGGAASKAFSKDRLSDVIDVEKSFVGGTRYDTAAAITKYYMMPESDTTGHKPKAKEHNIAIASGEQPADAVIAANFIAQYDGGVLLVNRSEAPTATTSYLDNLRRNNHKANLRAFGGKMWIPDSVIDEVVRYVNKANDTGKRK